MSSFDDQCKLPGAHKKGNDLLKLSKKACEVSHENTFLTSDKRDALKIPSLHIIPLAFFLIRRCHLKFRLLLLSKLQMRF